MNAPAAPSSGRGKPMRADIAAPGSSSARHRLAAEPDPRWLSADFRRPARGLLRPGASGGFPVRPWSWQDLPAPVVSVPASLARLAGTHRNRGYLLQRPASLVRWPSIRCSVAFLARRSFLMPTRRSQHAGRVRYSQFRSSSQTTPDDELFILGVNGPRNRGQNPPRRCLWYLRADAAPLNELWIPNRLVALEVETVIDKTYLTELPERVPEGKRAGAQSDIS